MRQRERRLKLNSDDSGMVTSDLKENQKLIDTESERREILTKYRHSPGSKASNLKVPHTHSQILLLLGNTWFLNIYNKAKENSVSLHFY